MSDNNFTVVDINKFAKPIDTFVKRISDAIAIVYEPTRIVRKAKADAQAVAIKAENDIHVRALKRAEQQEIRRQENLEAITAQAAPMLLEHSQPERLEDDWLTYFAKHCEDVSNEEMQSFWANILAGQATRPGSISKHTVSVASTMDRSDAEMFTRLCGFMVRVEHRPKCMVYENNSQWYADRGLPDFGEMTQLAALGLVSYDGLNGYGLNSTVPSFFMKYFDEPWLLRTSNTDKIQIDMGLVLLTKAGEELATICHATKVEGFFEYSLEHLRKRAPTWTVERL